MAQIKARVCVFFKDIKTRNSDFHVTQMGDQANKNADYYSALTKSDVVIITTTPNCGFAGRERLTIKIATILGVHNIILVVCDEKGRILKQSEFAALKKPFDEYIRSLSYGKGEDDDKVIYGVAIAQGGKEAGGDKSETASEILANISETINAEKTPFRMPVASVLKLPNSSVHKLSGKILSGNINTGDQIIILPAAFRSKIKAIWSEEKNITQALCGQSVQIELSQGTNFQPGDMICNGDQPVEAADQFETTIIWMSGEPMMSGRPYLLKSTTNEVNATITTLKYAINVDLPEPVAANRLEEGEIGVCNISLSKRVPF